MPAADHASGQPAGNTPIQFAPQLAATATKATTTTTTNSTVTKKKKSYTFDFYIFDVTLNMTSLCSNFLKPLQSKLQDVCVVTN